MAERPKFMYLLPNFQNPGGTTLAEGRRHELVLLADRYGIRPGDEIDLRVRVDRFTSVRARSYTGFITRPVR